MLPDMSIHYMNDDTTLSNGPEVNVTSQGTSVGVDAYPAGRGITMVTYVSPG